jgi:glycosyltransferase involved in cell wall biosynthesis
MISIVCPFYNESEAVRLFFAQLMPVISSLGTEFEIICVNDGSTDSTLESLLAAQRRYTNVKVVDLSRNFGKEAALTAGLNHASGDAVIPIDADLQDPPELIIKFVQYWRDGYEVVLARRVDRSTDTWMKRVSASLFYKLHNSISEIKIPENVGDFRLMDRKVVDAINQLQENRRFMKGLFAWVGFRSITIEYARRERSAGVSKFNGWRLWNFAIEGVASFSSSPLRVWTYIGITLAAIAFVSGLYIAFRTLLFGIVTPGYASLIVTMLLMSGVQLIGIGLLGEYIGRIYSEVKHRPVYLVRKIYDNAERKSL